MARDPVELSEIARVVDFQRRWATGQGMELTSDGRGLLHPSDALFAGTAHPKTETELREGAGREMNRLDRFRSSTCLALNVFDPWRDDPAGISSVLDDHLEAESLEFESTQPTGLGGTPPHLDVLIQGVGPTLGIECKFLELYSRADNAFRDSYFETAGLWSQLPKCRDLALRIADGDETFRWLAAAQLLKHALGLSRSQQGFRLLLVWYRVDGLIADEISVEIERFASSVDDIGFEAIISCRPATSRAGWAS